MDLTVFPSELLEIPRPHVGFMGLDLKNSVHKVIWDKFNDPKPDRALLQCKFIPDDYKFPQPKPKRPSYEWYFPHGILKRNWMLKHLHVLPAVVVLFQDLEFDDPMWSDREAQCAKLIEGLRVKLKDRNTRIVLVLIQNKYPQPEAWLATERSNSLINACGITNKMLLLLPYHDFTLGIMLRLEQAFGEMAQSYYVTMAKTIRSHRDQLASPSHAYLRIRHHFKLGFINEFRADYDSSHK